MRSRAFLSRSPGFSRVIGGIVEKIIWHNAPIIATDAKKAKSEKVAEAMEFFPFSLIFLIAE
jgi:hypothetical protein